jgi:hypothetical protein
MFSLRYEQILKCYLDELRLPWLIFYMVFLRCKEMLGFTEEGARPASPNHGGPQKRPPPPPIPRGLQPKRSHSFWLRLPDINPTRFLFVKGSLPEGLIYQPVAISLVWTCPSLALMRSHPVETPRNNYNEASMFLRNAGIYESTRCHYAEQLVCECVCVYGVEFRICSNKLSPLKPKLV